MYYLIVLIVINLYNILEQSSLRAEHEQQIINDMMDDVIRINEGFLAVYKHGKTINASVNEDMQK